MQIVSIVGARPEFIQALPLTRSLRVDHSEILVHTGQHYDYRMSQAFFDELELPEPDYNLEVGSGTQAWQTAEILVRLEKLLSALQPDLVIVRGDTNSTLAASITAAKLQIPLAHIEAGERSYARHMPEEINRLVADCLANIHFCSSQKAVQQLAAEGINHQVNWVGDVMLDAFMLTLPIARRKSTILELMQLSAQKYALVTIHRAANTDNHLRLAGIVDALNQAPIPVVFPAHPRTRNALESSQLTFNDNVRIIEPVGYLDMLVLEENAGIIATDSGGVQREAYFLQVPCLTLRDETEWTETVESGWNRLVGADTQQILENLAGFEPPGDYPAIFGDGNAAVKIANILSQLMLTQISPPAPSERQA